MAVSTERWTFTALIAALVMVVPLATDMYLPSLPDMAVVFDTTISQVQLTVSAWLFGFAFSQLFYGALSDRFGRRPIILFGLTVFCIASVACIYAPSIELLIVGRFFQAIGGGASSVLSRAIVRDVATGTRAVVLMSTVTTLMTIAPLIAPVIGGYLHNLYGWQSSFWVLVGACLLLLLVTVPALPETLKRKDPHAIRPMVMARNYRTLLQDARYLRLMALVVLSMTSFFTYISASSFVFQGVFGLEPQEFGIFFGLMVLGFSIGTFSTGRLVHRIGPHILVRIGVSLSGLGAIIYLAAALLLDQPGIVIVMIAQVFFAMGAGLMLPQLTTAAMRDYPHMAGAASSLIGFVQLMMGGMFGVIVGILLTDVAPGSAKPMMLQIGLIGLVALLVYARMPKTDLADEMPEQGTG